MLLGSSCTIRIPAHPLVWPALIEWSCPSAASASIYHSEWDVKEAYKQFACHVLIKMYTFTVG